MQFSKILATGSYLPKRVLTNAELEQMVNTSDEWIVSRSGIKERRIVAENEGCHDMCYHAALDAIKNANIDKSEIDLIIVATSTPDMPFPSTACLLQQKLEIGHVPAFDMQAACTGFIYGLATADAYIKSKMARTILLIGADVVSRYVDYTDRNTCVLFGDGAGAIILQATDENTGVLANKIYADGSGVDALSINGHLAGGQVKGRAFIDMDGKAVYKMAVKNLANVATEVLEIAKMQKEDINWLIPHQANIRIIEATADHLNIPMEKVIVTVDKHGNTSAASIPLALDHGIKSGKIKRGDLLMLEGVGAGFTWGASLVRY